MDRYAVVGNPIAHSKSPVIHAEFARQTGQTLHYTAEWSALDGFAQTLDRLRQAGFAGVNVTVPFKLEALAYADTCLPRAQAAGASNCLRFGAEVCEAENFDGVGLVRDIEVNLQRPLRGQQVLVLGAGGATRGALQPLLAAGASRVWVANRSADKAHSLLAEMTAYLPDELSQPLCASGFDGIEAAPFDVIINATSASLQAQALPLSGAVFDRHSLAYDMMYGQGLTPFLKQAQAAGVTHLADGVGMLVEQAAEAFAWWRGVRPATTEVIESIRIPLR